MRLPLIALALIVSAAGTGPAAAAFPSLWCHFYRHDDAAYRACLRRHHQPPPVHRPPHHDRHGSEAARPQKPQPY